MQFHLETYFKDIFTGQNINFNLTTIENLKARLARLLGVDNAEERIKDSVEKLLRLSKPKQWNPLIEDNAEVQLERDYQQMILTMEQYTNQDLNNISVHKFYSLIAFIRDKNKQDARE